ncbi:unnamed protein product [Amoebophrya sp. A25]|nr:unnamed protein product [Amoebophrya sp. A25]|eukprot:GSA25T00022487001.1
MASCSFFPRSASAALLRPALLLSSGRDSGDQQDGTQASSGGAGLETSDFARLSGRRDQLHGSNILPEVEHDVASVSLRNDHTGGRGDEGTIANRRDYRCRYNAPEGKKTRMLSSVSSSSRRKFPAALRQRRLFDSRPVFCRELAMDPSASASSTRSVEASGQSFLGSLWATVSGSSGRGAQQARGGQDFNRGLCIEISEPLPKIALGNTFSVDVSEHTGRTSDRVCLRKIGVNDFTVVHDVNESGTGDRQETCSVDEPSRASSASSVDTVSVVDTPSDPVAYLHHLTAAPSSRPSHRPVTAATLNKSSNSSTDAVVCLTRSNSRLVPESVDGSAPASVRFQDGKLVLQLQAAESGNDGGYVPQSSDGSSKRKIAKRDPANEETVAIVGAGAAGLACAQTLRLEGFTGRIAILSAEPPVDRTNLSKKMEAPRSLLPAPSAGGAASDANSDVARLRQEFDLELVTDVEVLKVDASGKQVEYRTVRGASDRKHLNLRYDKLLLATGCTPKSIYVPGAQNVGNIITMRSRADHKAILSHAKRGSKCVVVGAGLLGLEMAEMLTKAGCQVSLLDAEPLPLERRFGKRVAAGIAKWLAQNDVIYFGNAQARHFRGTKKRTNAVELDNGDVLGCDFVVVTAGTVPKVPKVEPSSAVDKARDGSR